MSSQPRRDSWWEPTWARLAATTVVLFLVIMAFLVGRVRAGADPGLARDASGRAIQQQPATPPSSSGSGGDPTEPFAQPQGADPGTAPGTSGSSSDNFGNAVPDQGGTQADPGAGGQSGQGFEPPSTHVS